MTHGHEVLAMMQGKAYTEEGLLKAIIEQFGPDERFYTCGECPDKYTCPKVAQIWQANPQAKKNLEA